MVECWPWMYEALSLIQHNMVSWIWPGSHSEALNEKGSLAQLSVLPLPNFLIFLFVLCLGSAEEWLLALCSGISPQRTIWGSRIELQLTTCKARQVLYLLWYHSGLLHFFLIRTCFHSFLINKRHRILSCTASIHLLYINNCQTVFQNASAILISSRNTWKVYFISLSAFTLKLL